MTLRTFIFCDHCNSQGIRLADRRRRSPWQRRLQGRRQSDGRSWFEGTEAEAIAAGWHTSQIGRHTCPGCVDRLRRRQPPSV